MSYFLIKTPVFMLNGDPASFVKGDIMLILGVAFMLFMLPSMQTRSANASFNMRAVAPEDGTR